MSDLKAALIRTLMWLCLEYKGGRRGEQRVSTDTSMLANGTRHGSCWKR